MGDTTFTTADARSVGEQLGIDWASSPFDIDQFRAGMDVELEHGTRDPDTDVTSDDPLLTGKIALAEEQARQALEMLEGRVDHLDEIGNAQLVLGRSLLAQDRLDEADEQFAAAESSFDQLSSASHRARAWMAQGELAGRRGDDRRAAKLYRCAAEALQDFHF